LSSAGLASSKSFDIIVTLMRDDSQVTFVGIDKSEQKVLMSYLKSKNVRLRTVDIETN